MPLEKSAGAIIFTQHHFPEKSSKQKQRTKNGAGFRKERGKNFYLLLHYQAGHWDFPKGNIERGEKDKETARREVREETGIEDIQFVEGFKETIKYFYRLKEKNIFKIVIFYLAETKTKDVKISREHIGYKWLPYKEALEQLTFKNTKEILQKANDYLMEHRT